VPLAHAHDLSVFSYRMTTNFMPFLSQSRCYTQERNSALKEALVTTWIRYQTRSREFGTDTALFDLDKAEAFEHNDGQGRENDGEESISVFLSAHHFVIEKQTSPKAFQIIRDHMKQLEKQAEGETKK
jgi:hypothetical protein